MRSDQKDAFPSSRFLDNIPSRFVSSLSFIERRLLPEYGSVLVARGGAKAPETLVFSGEAEVSEFQEIAGHEKARFGDYILELQGPAMSALLDAVAVAETAGLRISPRGQDSARRSYKQTEELWASRVEPGLDHWVKEGRLSLKAAFEIRSLSGTDQVQMIFELESQGMWFSKDLSKSIIYSVAPPGASQHLSMLAFDVAEFGNPKVREILAENGWFQTVVSDLPHFTYLGIEESELPSLGLKRVMLCEQPFWIPNIP
jgi:hypothetical protein